MLTALLVGVVLGFVLSIPPGPIGIAVIKHAVEGEYKNGTWLAMGAPQQVSREQYAELERSGKLALLDAPEWVTTANGVATLDFSLPRQGVSLVRISW